MPQTGLEARVMRLEQQIDEILDLLRRAECQRALDTLQSVLQA